MINIQNIFKYLNTFCDCFYKLKLINLLSFISLPAEMAEQWS